MRPDRDRMPYIGGKMALRNIGSGLTLQQAVQKHARSLQFIKQRGEQLERQIKKQATNNGWSSEFTEKIVTEFDQSRILFVINNKASNSMREDIDHNLINVMNLLQCKDVIVTRPKLTKQSPKYWKKMVEKGRTYLISPGYSNSNMKAVSISFTDRCITFYKGNKKVRVAPSVLKSLEKKCQKLNN